MIQMAALERKNTNNSELIETLGAPHACVRKVSCSECRADARLEDYNLKTG